MASTQPLPGRMGPCDWQDEARPTDLLLLLLLRLILLAESVCADSVGLVGIDVVVVSVELFFMLRQRVLSMCVCVWWVLLLFCFFFVLLSLKALKMNTANFAAL